MLVHVRQAVVPNFSFRKMFVLVHGRSNGGAEVFADLIMVSTVVTSVVGPVVTTEEDQASFQFFVFAFVLFWRMGVFRAVVGLFVFIIFMVCFLHRVGAHVVLHIALFVTVDAHVVWHRAFLF